MADSKKDVNKYDRFLNKYLFWNKHLFLNLPDLFTKGVYYYKY